MADYFAGDPQKKALDNTAELRQRFRIWQDQAAIWDAMEYPAKPSKELKTSANNMSNSTFIPTFIRASQVAYVNRMDRAEPYIEVALEEIGDVPDESQKRKSAAVERACYGMLNVVNVKAVRQIKATSMLRQLYSSSGNPGKIVQFLHMREKRDGTADPVWDIIDPRNCYHDFDQTPFRFVREYFQSASTVRAEYEGLGIAPGESEEAGLEKLASKEKEKNPEVHVINHWVVINLGDRNEVWNTFLVEDAVLFHRKTRFNRLPFQIFVTNSSPSIYQNVWTGVSAGGASLSAVISDTRMARHAQPFWAPLEPTMEQLAEGMSLLMKAVALMVNAPYLHFSDTGSEVKGNSVLRTPGQEITLSTDLKEDIKLLDVVRQVPDALGVLNYLIKEMDRIVPAAAFGQTAVSGESGYLYDKRSRDAALVAFADPARAASIAIQMGLSELLEQFREASGIQIKLSAMDVNGDSAGKLWYRNFKAEDIPDSFVLKVRVAPELPDDDAKAAQIASMLLQAGIADPEYVMSKILGIKDPIAMTRRIEQARAARLPMIDILHAIEQLSKEAEDNRARAAQAQRDGKQEFVRLYRFNAARLEEWRIAMERQLVGKQTQPQPQPSPQLLNGPSPEVLPPEQYNNPDEKAGALNKVSSSLAGRPPSRNGGKEE